MISPGDDGFGCLVHRPPPQYLATFSPKRFNFPPFLDPAPTFFTSLFLYFLLAIPGHIFAQKIYFSAFSRSGSFFPFHFAVSLLSFGCDLVVIWLEEWHYFRQRVLG